MLANFVINNRFYFTNVINDEVDAIIIFKRL